MKNRMKELRERNGLTQRELADHINATQQSISKWENEDNELPIDIAFAIADYFRVNIEYLMCRSEKPMPISSEAMKLYNIIFELKKSDQDVVYIVAKSLHEKESEKNV